MKTALTEKSANGASLLDFPGRRAARRTVARACALALIAAFFATITFASQPAVDVLNAPATGIDALQLRIINLRKRAVNDRGALAYGRQDALLSRIQEAIYRGKVSAGQIAQWNQELDRLGAD